MKNTIKLLLKFKWQINSFLMASACSSGITWLDFGQFSSWRWLWIVKVNMEFAISQSKMVGLPRNEKQTYWLNSWPQMWPMGLTLAINLTLNFQGQIWNLLYLSLKWSDCHQTKSKRSIALSAKNVTNGFGLGHDLELEFSRSNYKGWESVIHDHDHDLLWPRWGVRMYRIVIGVSDVSMPLTRLISIICIQHMRGRYVIHHFQDERSRSHESFEVFVVSASWIPHCHLSALWLLVHAWLAFGGWGVPQLLDTVDLLVFSI